MYSRIKKIICIKTLREKGEKMKRLLVVYLIILISLLFESSFAQIHFNNKDYQEVIYIKEGNARLVYGPIVKGLIIELIPDSTISILTKEGTKLTYLIKDIEKITREEYEPLTIEAPIQTTQKSIWDEPINEENRKQITIRRDPGTAFALSFLIPGLGQIYNGETGKGVMFFLGVFGSYVLAFTAGIEDSDVFTFGICLGIGLHLWSIIDAPVTANRINRKNGLSLQLKPYNKGVQLGLVYNF